MFAPLPKSNSDEDGPGSGAAALVCRAYAAVLDEGDADTPPRWLAWKHDCDGVCTFPMGYATPRRSFRDAARDEFARVTGLEVGRHFVCDCERLSRVRHDFPSRSDRDAAPRLASLWQLYRVRLTEAGHAAIRDDARCVWLTQEDIRAQRAPDGSPIDSAIVPLVATSDVYC